MKFIFLDLTLSGLEKCIILILFWLDLTLAKNKMCKVTKIYSTMIFFKIKRCKNISSNEDAVLVLYCYNSELFKPYAILFVLI